MLFSNLVCQVGTGPSQPPEVNLISAEECNNGMTDQIDVSHQIYIIDLKEE